MQAIFDVGHGQENWEHTGFQSRTLTGSCNGLKRLLSVNGFSCSPGCLSNPLLETMPLLVIPSPAGRFNRQYSRWEPSKDTRFKEPDIESILDYVRNGGRLIAFSYRFGDSFAKTNLKDVFLPMGCLINDTAALNLDSFVNDIHPLAVPFQTSQEHLPILDATVTPVSQVHWRAMATLSILPGANVSPIAMTSPRCIVFDPHSYQLIHKPQVIAAGGHFGMGRFVLLGGPHVFETGGYGLLNEGENREFANIVLRWLMSEDKSQPSLRFVPKTDNEDSKQARALWTAVQHCKSPKSKEAVLVQFIDHVFMMSGIMGSLGESVWNLKRTSELDLVYRTVCSQPIWTQSNGIIPVECKNWEKPVGSQEISWFCDKVAKTGSKLGYFAARQFTKQAWLAAEQMLMAKDITIGLLTDDDYQSLLSGCVSARDLLESSLLRSRLL